MTRRDGEIAIVGSGLSGMVVSRALSRAGIAHTMIGRPPSDRPRLGESINPEGTVDLLRSYPEYEAHFHAKNTATLYIGDFSTSSDFQIAGRGMRPFFFRALGLPPPQRFLHLERVGFDRALYADVTRSPCCTPIEADPAALDYDPESDAITAVTLADGGRVDARFVFDASNHQRLAGKAACVPLQYTSGHQRVVYTHYLAGADALGREPGWLHATNLLRLSRETDAVEGFAWCIPLGRIVSVGISMPVDGPALDDEAVLEAVEEGYARRGIRYRRFYDKPREVQTLVHRYFVHERAFGPNWFMVGPSFAQIWYMSGSGVGTALAAARIAPQLLRGTRGPGRRYEAYMRELVRGHATFEWFVNVSPATLRTSAVQAKADALVQSNLRRLCAYARLRERLGAGAAARLLQAFLSRSSYYSTGYCDTFPLDLDQRDDRFEAAPAALREPVQLVFDAISGRRPLEDAEAVLDPGVTLWMDGDRFTGPVMWRDWVAFLRSRRGLAAPELIPERASVDGEWLRARGRWRARRGDRVVHSDPIWGAYRVRDGRIVEIRTHRENYRFLLGRVVESRAGFLAYVWAWRRRRGSGASAEAA